LGHGACVPRADNFSHAGAFEKSHRRGHYLRSLDERIVFTTQCIRSSNVHAPDRPGIIGAKNQRPLWHPRAGFVRSGKIAERAITVYLQVITCGLPSPMTKNFARRTSKCVTEILKNLSSRSYFLDQWSSLAKRERYSKLWEERSLADFLQQFLFAFAMIIFT